MLGQVRREAFELRLDGLPSFGGRKPRAVVATVAPSQAVMELQAEHERLMQRVGLEPEGRKYTPHVTLARLRDSSSRRGRGLSVGARGVPLAAVHGVALRAVLVARLGRRRAVRGRGGLSAGGVGLRSCEATVGSRSCSGNRGVAASCTATSVVADGSGCASSHDRARSKRAAPRRERASAHARNRV